MATTQMARESPRTERVVVGSILLATALVHRRSLQAFFTPDDLVTLEMAAGIRPAFFTIWRLLSESLYFRVMLPGAGLHPLPYHVVSMVLHLTNTAGLYWLAKRFGAERWGAALAALIFGAHPIFTATLSQAVSINDILSCSLLLLTLRLLFLRGWAGTVFPALTFSLALLSKESILFIPLVFWWLRGRGESPSLDRRGTRALLILSGVFAALFFYMRTKSLAPGGTPYSLHLGTNLFQNLTTYLVWAVDVARPRSINETAWVPGVWVVAFLAAGAAWCRNGRTTIRIGLAWWLLGLLPVLGLVNRTYSQYMYVPMLGFATALGSCVCCWLTRTTGRRGITSASPDTREPATQGTAIRRALRYWVPIAMSVCMCAYAIRAEHLIGARLNARVASVDLPVDNFTRKMEVALRSLQTLGEYLGPGRASVAIFIPEGTEVALGTSSGSQYRQVPPGRQAYNLFQAVLDQGLAVRLFYPQVDTVAFVYRWGPALRDFKVFVPSEEGYLVGFGSGPRAHTLVAGMLLREGHAAAALPYLRTTVEMYPKEAMLRMLYSGALNWTGDQPAGLDQLRELIRSSPGDSLAAVAMAILRESPNHASMQREGVHRPREPKP